MRKCEWHCIGLKCEKIATHVDVKDIAYCMDHVDCANGDFNGIVPGYRIPLDGEILAHLLTEELEAHGMRVDHGIALVAGKERALDAQDDEYAQKAKTFLDAVADRWNKGDL